MDWNEDWTHAFRWRPIRSMEADEASPTRPRFRLFRKENGTRS